MEGGGWAEGGGRQIGRRLGRGELGNDGWNARIPYCSGGREC